MKELKLSDRTRNTLLRRGITTTAQVGAMTDSELLSLYQIGPKALAEIKNAYFEWNECHHYDDWTVDWPIEPGWYWFYGWPSRWRDHQPEMHLVKTRISSNGRPMHVTNGRFLFREEHGFGVWKCTSPPPPPYSRENILRMESEND